MKKISYILIILTVLLTGCDENINVGKYGILPSRQETSHGMKVVKTSLSNDSSKILVYLDRTVEAGEFNYSDPKQVDVKVTEYDTDMTKVSRAAQPQVKSITDIGVQKLKNAGLVVNVLVDLTQPTNVLNKQREYIYDIANNMSQGNLFLTFMYAFGKRSHTMAATQYVIENYISLGQLQFDKSDSIGLPYIYHTVNSVVREMESSYEPVWTNAKYKALIIFADGIVYDGDTNLPLDPNHFETQLQLVRQARHVPNNLVVSYVSLTPENVDPAIVDVNMMKMLCNKSKGQFYDSFSWEIVKKDIEAAFNIQYPDYLVVLDNPQEKIYSGNKRYIKISFTTPKDSLLAQGVTNYRLGSVYNQVKIGDFTLKYVLMKGLIYGGALLLFIYLIIQIVVPYVRYRLFRKKYVARYIGGDMVLNSINVPKTCYYCKAPFRPGEFVVAKCNHVMHEECWNENDYHCPEHGTHCPEGSHYYNQHNLLDPKNATFYLKWLIVASLAGMLAWLLTVTVEQDLFFLGIEDILCYIFSIENPNHSQQIPTNLNIMTARMYIQPSTGVFFSMIVTLFLSLLTTHHTKWYKRLRDIALRTIAATVATFLLFVFEDFVIVLGQLYDYEYFLDWIPWTITAFVIMYLVTVRSRVRLNHRYMIIAFGGIFISSMAWNVFGNIDTVNEVLQIICCNIISALAIAFSIARNMTPNEHYFLHVSGEIKEMDIALYKWLGQTPESEVYIGRSVDCQLQISWDIKSEIAPVHAAIINDHGVPLLSTVDGEVFLNGKSIREDKLYHLYHGDTIQIGLTTFKFLEM